MKASSYPTESNESNASADSMSLANALLVLSCRNFEDRRIQETAARRLLRELDSLAVSMNRKFSSTYLPGLDDAVQRTALIAVTTSSPYIGETEAGARAWCRRVLSREARHGGQSEPPNNVVEPDALPSSAAPVQITPDQLRPLLDAVRMEIGRHHAGRARAVWAAVTCHVERVAGMSVATQAWRLLGTELKLCAPQCATPRLRTRTNDRWLSTVRRVYRMRHAGRIAGLRAVRRLQQKGELPACLELAASALGLLGSRVG